MLSMLELFQNPEKGKDLLRLEIQEVIDSVDQQDVDEFFPYGAEKKMSFLTAASVRSVCGAGDDAAYAEAKIAKRLANYFQNQADVARFSGEFAEERDCRELSFFYGKVYGDAMDDMRFRGCNRSFLIDHMRNLFGTYDIPEEYIYYDLEKVREPLQKLSVEQIVCLAWILQDSIENLISAVSLQRKEIDAFKQAKEDNLREGVRTSIVEYNEGCIRYYEQKKEALYQEIVRLRHVVEELCDLIAEKISEQGERCR